MEFSCNNIYLFVYLIATTRSQRGSVYLKLGKFGEAENDFRKVVKIITF